LLNRVSALLASAASQQEHTETRTDQLTALSRERLASIVESVMEAIITVDQTQRIVLFNKAAESIFRCPTEQALGRTEPFFTTKGEKGTGLGLWVSRSLVEKHGGRLYVRSTPGVGTAFSIFLPATTPASVRAAS
jgi:signal transduction histidine kinase